MTTSSSKLNIVQVVASTGNGGLEKHAIDLSMGLVERGHSVTFVTTNVLVSRLPEGISPVVLPLEGNRSNPILLYRLLMALRDQKFDVVHAQGNKAVQMVSNIRGFLPRGLMTIGTLHNQKRSLGAFRNLHHAIGVSRALTADIGQSNCTTIYHGLMNNPTEAIDVELASSHRPNLVAIGRLVEAKGFDNLISAWTAVDANLFIVGEGPDSDNLQKQVMSLGLEDRVTLVGYSNNIRGYLKACDGVVVSSRREGFSYVVAEALLSRKPVVSTNVPVANEVLPENLIMSGDVADMSQVLSEVVANLSDWKKNCEAAFDFAKSEFVYERMLDKTESLYRELISKRNTLSAQG